MYKIAKIEYGGYAEISQPAPIRWVMMYADGDTLVPQSGWWKCKDFLNDVIIYLRTGKEFGIYGFRNKAKINDDCGYLAVKNVPDFFDNNLALLNDYLLSKGFDPVGLVEHDGKHEVAKVLQVPTMYWENTFFISAITSLIRSCVYKEWTNSPDFIVEPTLTSYMEKLDGYLQDKYIERCNNLVFSNYQYNMDNLPESTSIYHNAGLQSWINSWKQQDA